MGTGAWKRFLFPFLYLSLIHIYNLCNDTVVCAVNDRTGGIPFEVLAERMYDKYIYEHSRDRVLSALIN